eukprot:11223350-Lingulodinium_polyedra.AAC.1
MARLHARSWGLQQGDKHTAAMPRVDWHSLRQETKQHVAAMCRDTFERLQRSFTACLSLFYVLARTSPVPTP